MVGAIGEQTRGIVRAWPPVAQGTCGRSATETRATIPPRSPSSPCNVVGRTIFAVETHPERVAHLACRPAAVMRRPRPSRPLTGQDESDPYSFTGGTWPPCRGMMLTYSQTWVSWIALVTIHSLSAAPPLAAITIFAFSASIIPRMLTSL